MAVVGMTSPECLGLEELMNKSFFLQVSGGSNYLSAARCNLPNRDEENCLREFSCPEGNQPTFAQIPWRQVRANNGLVIAPNTYTHILDCAEPVKDTK
jgi:hypothetical protein